MTKRIFGLMLVGLLLTGAGCADSGPDSDTLELEETPLNQGAGDQQGSAPQQNQPTSMNDTNSQYEFPGKLPDEEIQDKQIRLETEKGDIVFELFPDTAPLAVSNMVYLTKEGFYDGLTFHRRVEDFVIQGGDPRGNGTGGPGYKFEDELDDDYSYDRGIVAMANSGPDTNGSQFFIMLADNDLPKNYTIFGRVTEGMDVVDEIAIGDKMTSVEVEDKE
jgi:cyclophilin family peptidyl-prolyl cis-trans isomerase